MNGCHFGNRQTGAAAGKGKNGYTVEIETEISRERRDVPKCVSEEAWAGPSSVTCITKTSNPYDFICRAGFNARHFRECFITGAVRRTNVILYVNVCVRYWNWETVSQRISLNNGYCRMRRAFARGSARYQCILTFVTPWQCDECGTLRSRSRDACNSPRHSCCLSCWSLILVCVSGFAPLHFTRYTLQNKQTSRKSIRTQLSIPFCCIYKHSRLVSAPTFLPVMWCAR